jgi:putative membrane protein
VSLSDLPALNATLNAISALLLIVGRVAIAGGRQDFHRRTMITALSVSAAFLTSYLIYHAQHGSTPFEGEGWSRSLYFSILISHTILAASLVPLVIVTVRRALRRDFEAHRRIARITWPVWFYVSVTGVLIYFMLYQWFAADSL